MKREAVRCRSVCTNGRVWIVTRCWVIMGLMMVLLFGSRSCGGASLLVRSDEEHTEPTLFARGDRIELQDLGILTSLGRPFPIDSSIIHPFFRHAKSYSIYMKQNSYLQHSCTVTIPDVHDHEHQQYHYSTVVSKTKTNTNKRTTSEEEERVLQSVVRGGYHRQWMIDGLPAAYQPYHTREERNEDDDDNDDTNDDDDDDDDSNNNNGKQHDDDLDKVRYNGGFPIGYIDSNQNADDHDDNLVVYLYNHLTIELQYEKVRLRTKRRHPKRTKPNMNKFRIVGFVIRPSSIRHPTIHNDNDHDDDYTIRSYPSCRSLMIDSDTNEKYENSARKQTRQLLVDTPPPPPPPPFLLSNRTTTTTTNNNNDDNTNTKAWITKRILLPQLSHGRILFTYNVTWIRRRHHQPSSSTSDRISTTSSSFDRWDPYVTPTPRYYTFFLVCYTVPILLLLGGFLVTLTVWNVRMKQHRIEQASYGVVPSSPASSSAAATAASSPSSSLHHHHHYHTQNHHNRVSRKKKEYNAVPSSPSSSSSFFPHHQRVEDRFSSSPLREEEEDDDEGKVGGKEEGWKSVRANVFRAPSYTKLGAACWGWGIQLLTTFIIYVFLVVFGLLSPLGNRYQGGPSITSTTTTTTVLLTVYTVGGGGIAGYQSARIFKTWRGRGWKRTTMITAMGLPSLWIGTVGIGNGFAMMGGELYAQPFSSIVLVSGIGLVTMILAVFVGAWRGYGRERRSVPCPVDAIPREIPRRRCYVGSRFFCLLGGIVPLLPLLEILNRWLGTVWLDRQYRPAPFFTIFGVLMAFVAAAEVGVVVTYLTLKAEDYRWWWKSFLSAGWSCGGWVWVYCLRFYIRELRNVMADENVETGGVAMGVVPTVIYILWSTAISIAVALVMGTVGVAAAERVVRAVYGVLEGNLGCVGDDVEEDNGGVNGGVHGSAHSSLSSARRGTMARMDNLDTWRLTCARRRCRCVDRETDVRRNSTSVV